MLNLLKASFDFQELQLNNNHEIVTSLSAENAAKEQNDKFTATLKLLINNFLIQNNCMHQNLSVEVKKLGEGLCGIVVCPECSIPIKISTYNDNLKRMRFNISYFVNHFNKSHLGSSERTTALNSDLLATPTFCDKSRNNIRKKIKLSVIDKNQTAITDHFELIDKIISIISQDVRHVLDQNILDITNSTSNSLLSTRTFLKCLMETCKKKCK